MTARSLIGRVLLATLVAGGAVACKKDPEPSKPAERAGGDGTDVSTSTPGGETKELQRGKLPPMPHRGAGTLADRKKPWADGERPTRDELVQRRDQRRQDMLAAFDSDQDGQLSDEESAQMRESRVAIVVDRMDTDRDGRLSKAEMEDMMNRGRRALPEFEKIDADKDGFVTVEEMAKHGPRRPRRDRARPGDEGAPPPAEK